MAEKLSVAIVGSGNISTDLLYKLLRSGLDPVWWTQGQAACAV